MPDNSPATYFYYFKLCIGSCECTWVPSDVRGVRSPSTGVRNDCEPPDVGAGERSWVLWESSKCSLPLSPLPRLWGQIILRLCMNTGWGLSVLSIARPMTPKDASSFFRLLPFLLLSSYDKRRFHLRSWGRV